MTYRLCQLLLCVALLSTGCQTIQGPFPAPPPSEQQLLSQVVDDLVNGRPAAKLIELERLYPQSPTTQRARTLSAVFARMEKQITQLEKENDRCQQEKGRLSKDFQQLQEDQQKLRNLVIEMERRRR